MDKYEKGMIELRLAEEEVEAAEAEIHAITKKGRIGNIKEGNAEESRMSESDADVASAADSMKDDLTKMNRDLEAPMLCEHEFPFRR